MNAWMKLDKLDQLDVGNLSKKKCLSTHFQILKNRSICLDGFWDSHLSFAENRIFSTSINFFSIMVIPLTALKPQYSGNKLNLWSKKQYITCLYLKMIEASWFFSQKMSIASWVSRHSLNLVVCLLK